MRKVEKLLRLCERCANPFQIYPSFKHAARFCSVACRSETASAKLIRIGWTVTPSGCWEWNGWLSPKGYGRIYSNGRNIGAHCASWEYHRGPIPQGVCVLHRCDNRPCINPDDLFLGTRADNNFDMRSKGRSVPPRGESHGASKLTIPAIRLIRETPVGPNVTRELAERFSVSRATICNVRSRKVWAHVA